MNGTRRRPREISQSPSPTLNVQIIKTINWIIFLLLFQTISGKRMKEEHEKILNV